MCCRARAGRESYTSACQNSFEQSSQEARAFLYGSVNARVQKFKRIKMIFSKCVQMPKRKLIKHFFSYFCDYFFFFTFACNYQEVGGSVCALLNVFMKCWILRAKKKIAVLLWKQPPATLISLALIAFLFLSYLPTSRSSDL